MSEYVPPDVPKQPESEYKKSEYKKDNSKRVERIYDKLNSAEDQSGVSVFAYIDKLHDNNPITEADEFDPMADALIMDLAKESFFHASVTMEEVKELLPNNGDFIVRIPERTRGQVVLTMRVEQDIRDFPFHFLKHGPDQKERLVTINGNYVRRSIVELLHDHMSFGISVDLYTKLVLSTPVVRPKLELPKELLVKEKVIGEGAFGSVWSGKLKSEKGDGPPSAVAIKQTNQGATSQVVNDILSEAKVMKQLQHTNIVAFYGIILDDSRVLIVMELVTGRGLDRYLRKNKVPNPDKYSYCYDVANGLAYLHSKRFIHRDVASRNCLIDTARNMVKLSDFGMSKQVDVYRIQPNERTPIRWQAPEVLKTAIYTKESDVYSFAMVMYEIFCDGKQPFGGYDNKTIRAKILDPEFRPPVPSNIPDDIRAVMTTAWSALPCQRTTMKLITYSLSKYCKHNAPLARASGRDTERVERKLSRESLTAVNSAKKKKGQKSKMSKESLTNAGSGKKNSKESLTNVGSGKKTTNSNESPTITTGPCKKNSRESLTNLGSGKKNSKESLTNVGSGKKNSKEPANNVGSGKKKTSAENLQNSGSTRTAMRKTSKVSKSKR